MQSKYNILFLSTCSKYLSLKKSNSGAPLRTHFICEKYAEFGHVVFKQPRLYAGSRIEVSAIREIVDADSFLPEELKFIFLQMLKTPLLAKEISALQSFCSYFLNRNRYVEWVQSLQAKVDVIHFEFPYLFLVAQFLQKSFFPDARLIYSSHNVENVLFKDLRADGSVRQEFFQFFYDYERYVASHVDGVICCSDKDAETFKSYGAKLVAKARNGAFLSNCFFWHKFRTLLATRFRPYALYIANDWEVNVNGFFDWLGADLRFLPDKTCVVLAGSVAKEIKRHPQFLKCKQENRGKIVFAGEMSHGQLAAYRKYAQVIVLPITIGGGTNLKTAEALLSGHYVVGTEKSFRGLQDFASEKRVNIAKTPEEFKSFMCEKLQEPPYVVSADENRRMSSLVWGSTMQPIIDDLLLPMLQNPR